MSKLLAMTIIAILASATLVNSAVSAPTRAGNMDGGTKISGAAVGVRAVVGCATARIGFIATPRRGGVADLSWPEPRKNNPSVPAAKTVCRKHDRRRRASLVWAMVSGGLPPELGSRRSDIGKAGRGGLARMRSRRSPPAFADLGTTNWMTFMRGRPSLTCRSAFPSHEMSLSGSRVRFARHGAATSAAARRR